MPNLTRSDLVARIGDLIGDPSNTRWSAAKKQQKIDEWQERFIADTRGLKSTQTTALVAGTASYSLPTDIFDVIRVSHNGLAIKRTSEFDLDTMLRANWATVNGTPTDYYVDLDATNKKIVLYPIPVSADVAYNLLIEYVPIPATLATDSTVPFNTHSLLTPYHMAIAYGAAADLMRSTIATSPNAQALLVNITEYVRQYEKLVSECIDMWRGMFESKPLNLHAGRGYRGL